MHMTANSVESDYVERLACPGQIAEYEELVAVEQQLEDNEELSL